MKTGILQALYFKISEKIFSRLLCCVFPAAFIFDAYTECDDFFHSWSKPAGYLGYIYIHVCGMEIFSIMSFSDSLQVCFGLEGVGGAFNTWGYGWNLRRLGSR